MLIILTQDDASFYTSLESNGIMTTPRMGLNYTLFRGASFRIKDVVQEHNHASMIAAMSTVKQIWPIRNYTVPEIQRKNIMSNPSGAITHIEDMPVANEDAATKRDTFSTHAMTQVDKLRREGSTFNLFSN